MPEVLLNGNHKEIDLWRRKQALKRTLLKRPDLIRTAELDKKDHQNTCLSLVEEFQIPDAIKKLF